MRMHRGHRGRHLGAQRVRRRARAPRAARGAALHGAAQRVPRPGDLRAGGAMSAAPLNSLLDIGSSACLPHACRTCGVVDTAGTRRKYVLTTEGLTTEGSTDMLTTPCIEIFLTYRLRRVKNAGTGHPHRHLQQNARQTQLARGCLATAGDCLGQQGGARLQQERADGAVLRHLRLADHGRQRELQRDAQAQARQRAQARLARRPTGARRVGLHCARSPARAGREEGSSNSQSCM